MDVARSGQSAAPPVPPPRALAPYVRFKRFSDRALTAARRCLEDDEGFRARVAAAADEAALGRHAWLFLVRPPGWEEELEGAAREARASESAATRARVERQAERRAEVAERDARRAEESARRARADAGKSARVLAAERDARRAAEREVRRLARRVGAVEAELAGSQQAGEELVARLEELGRRLEDAEAAARAERPLPPPGPDPGLVRAALARARAAATALEGALRQLDGALETPPPGATAARGGSRPPGRGEERSTGAAAGGGTAETRTAPRMPPGVLEDSVEAAAHLVRVNGAVLLVDGYNVAKAVWPELGPSELRDRLVDALSELTARTGVDVQVVFDGADVAPPRSAARSPVRVSFSPPDVEADDVILELVGALPVHRPVVVASSDRRVQEGAREGGAAVISASQLGAVLGR